MKKGQNITPDMLPREVSSLTLMYYNILWQESTLPLRDFLSKFARVNDDVISEAGRAVYSLRNRLAASGWPGFTFNAAIDRENLADIMRKALHDSDSIDRYKAIVRIMGQAWVTKYKVEASLPLNDCDRSYLAYLLDREECA